MYDQVGQNKRRTIVLMVVFVLFVAVVAGAFAFVFKLGPVGIVFALVFAGVSGFVGYWKSDSVALAMSRAKPADRQEYARLYNLVEGLCIAVGPADAAALHRRRRGPQRLRHRPQPQARRGGRHHRPARRR